MKRKIIIGSVLFVVLAAIFVFFYFANSFFPREEILITASIDTVVYEEPENYYEFGIAIDSFDIFRAKIRQGDHMGKVLGQYNVPAGVVEKIITAAEGVFDLRDIRFDQPYNIYCSKDTSMRVRHFVYEHSLLDYLKISFLDTVKVEYKRRIADTLHRKSTGTIKKSLWATVMENNLNPELVHELSEIYAWSINFFGLLKKDSFMVVYDEIYVDTNSVGISNIYAAVFRHSGKDFFAIPFFQDSVMSFFDENGQSLRKEFLKAPLRFSFISSGFSGRRYHPVLKTYTTHYAIDYAAPYGTPVMAISDGLVTAATYHPGNGYYVKITHNSVHSSAYLHLNGFAKGIAAGSHVKQGDVIGYVGSTGLSTGPHLDFRLYKNGHPINPFTFESPPVEPVKEENLAAFDSVKNIVVSKLLIVEE